VADCTTRISSLGDSDRDVQLQTRIKRKPDASVEEVVKQFKYESAKFVSIRMKSYVLCGIILNIGCPVLTLMRG
jgi:hypothetical protein